MAFMDKGSRRTGNESIGSVDFIESVGLTAAARAEKSFFTADARRLAQTGSGLLRIPLQLPFSPATCGAEIADRCAMKVCGVHGCVARGTTLLCSRPQGGGLIRPAGRRADITLSAVVRVGLR
jgi:hypothetical protein